MRYKVDYDYSTVIKSMEKATSLELPDFPIVAAWFCETVCEALPYYITWDYMNGRISTNKETCDIEEVYNMFVDAISEAATQFFFSLNREGGIFNV